ncbi:MAG: hypothetical protein IKE75_04720 [Bacilli bacterium]|nr:hypothetical protein [Bacilli bacterium]
MKVSKFLCVILFCFAFIPIVSAKEVNHFVSKVDNDVVLDHNYNSSVAAAGQSISVNGNVKGVSATAGNAIKLNGISDYAFVAGNDINVNGTINNDAFIAGNIITFEEDAVVKRDTVIAGSDVEISGNFDRNVSVYAGKVTVKGAVVKGNLKIYSENITVDKLSNVSGTLYYPEDSNYKASKESHIANTQKTPAIQTEDEENYFATLTSKIWSFLGLALIFAAMSLFFPQIFDKINDKYEKFEVSEAVEVFTKGLVVLILVPVVALLLCITMIGIPLGIVLLILYGLSLYLTTIFTSYLVGYKIWQKVFNKEAHVLLFGLIGLFVILILELIPGVRTLVAIVSVLVGLGVIFDMFKKQ